MNPTKRLAMFALLFGWLALPVSQRLPSADCRNGHRRAEETPRSSTSAGEKASR